MTIDEAIKHTEEVMIENLENTKDRNASDPIAINCFECADEHRQLAEWLKELKQLKEQNTWIPVSERAPEEGKTVIASTEYGVYPETRFTKEYGWEWAYEAGADYWRELKDVLAWMPLPEPYKGE